MSPEEFQAPRATTEQDLRASVTAKLIEGLGAGEKEIEKARELEALERRVNEGETLSAEEAERRDGLRTELVRWVGERKGE